MALCISCPNEAQILLRKHLGIYGRTSIEYATKELLRQLSRTEAQVRHIAVAKQMPISGVVRALAIAKYPDLKELWPKPAHSAAQIKGFVGRTKPPTRQLSETLPHLAIMVNREETGQTLRRAKEHLLANGYSLVDGRYVLTPTPSTLGAPPCT